MLRVVTFLEEWTFDPVPAYFLIIIGASYLWAARRVVRNNPDRPWPRRNTASFLAGIALAWVAILGPPGGYDDTFFWAHMVQHLILVMLAAPLLLLGAPVLLMLRVSSRRVRHDHLVPVLRSRALTLATNPVLGWLLFAGVLVGTHFSPFFDYSLRHPLVHRLVEHPLYLGVALSSTTRSFPATPAPGGWRRRGALCRCS